MECRKPVVYSNKINNNGGGDGMPFLFVSPSSSNILRMCNVPIPVLSFGNNIFVTLVYVLYTL